MKQSTLCFLITTLMCTSGFAQDAQEYPSTGLGPVETLVQFRNKIISGDTGAYWDILAPDVRKSLIEKKSDKQFIEELNGAGITAEQIKSSSIRQLATLINDKFLRMQDDPTLKLNIKQISFERFETDKNRASKDIEFESGGGSVQLLYNKEHDAWLMDRNFFERLPPPKKD